MVADRHATRISSPLTVVARRPMDPRVVRGFSGSVGDPVAAREGGYRRGDGSGDTPVDGLSGPIDGSAVPSMGFVILKVLLDYLRRIA